MAVFLSCWRENNSNPDQNVVSVITTVTNVFMSLNIQRYRLGLSIIALCTHHSFTNLQLTGSSLKISLGPLDNVSVHTTLLLPPQIYTFLSTSLALLQFFWYSDCLNGGFVACLIKLTSMVKLHSLLLHFPSSAMNAVFTAFWQYLFFKILFGRFYNF